MAHDVSTPKKNSAFNPRSLCEISELYGWRIRSRARRKTDVIEPWRSCELKKIIGASDSDVFICSDFRSAPKRKKCSDVVFLSYIDRAVITCALLQFIIHTWKKRDVRWSAFHNPHMYYILLYIKLYKTLMTFHKTLSNVFYWKINDVSYCLILFTVFIK